MHILQVLPTIEGSSAEVSPCPSPVPVTGRPPLVSSITTTFPLPPASPVPPTSSSSHPLYSVTFPSHQPDSSLSSAFLQLPRTMSPPIIPHLDEPVEQLRVSYQAISPLPDIRRGSHNEFEFPPNIPVPREFADVSRKNSMQEGKDIAIDRCPIPIEDIEVRIQSSTDNLVDVGDDEPYTFEEKSITEIRDSLVNSLDNSLDIDEEWGQTDGKDENRKKTKLEEEPEGMREDTQGSEGEKTEALDSDETDETVKETHKTECREDENAIGDDATPEGETSVIEDIITNVNEQEDAEVVPIINIDDVYESESEGLEPHREEPTGEESQVDVCLPEVPLAQEEFSENIEDELEEDMVPPPSERIVEGAEAVTEDEMEEDEKGEDCE